MQFTEAGACSWHWYRGVAAPAVTTARGAKGSVVSWSLLSRDAADGAVYVPEDADEGCMLRVECHPPAAAEVRSIEVASVGRV